MPFDGDIEKCKDEKHFYLTQDATTKQAHDRYSHNSESENKRMFDPISNDKHLSIMLFFGFMVIGAIFILLTGSILFSVLAVSFMFFTGLFYGFLKEKDLLDDIPFFILVYDRIRFMIAAATSFFLNLMAFYVFKEWFSQ